MRRKYTIGAEVRVIIADALPTEEDVLRELAAEVSELVTTKVRTLPWAADVALVWQVDRVEP